MQKGSSWSKSLLTNCSAGDVYGMEAGYEKGSIFPGVFAAHISSATDGMQFDKASLSGGESTAVPSPDGGRW